MLETKEIRDSIDPKYLHFAMFSMIAYDLFCPRVCDKRTRESRINGGLVAAKKHHSEN